MKTVNEDSLWEEIADTTSSHKSLTTQQLNNHQRPTPHKNPTIQQLNNNQQAVTSPPSPKTT